MKRLLRSRILVACLFGLIGAVATLAATGNLPGLSGDPSEEPRRTTTSRARTDASEPGTAFTTHPESESPRADAPSGRVRRYSSENDYRDQLYEQYFGYEEEEEVDEDETVFVRPEEGAGSGEPGEPGEPGIPGDGEDDSGDGAGGPGGPGGEGGG